MLSTLRVRVIFGRLILQWIPLYSPNLSSDPILKRIVLGENPLLYKSSQYSLASFWLKSEKYLKYSFIDVE